MSLGERGRLARLFWPLAEKLPIALPILLEDRTQSRGSAKSEMRPQKGTSLLLQLAFRARVADIPRW